MRRPFLAGSIQLVSSGVGCGYADASVKISRAMKTKPRVFITHFPPVHTSESVTFGPQAFPSSSLTPSHLVRYENYARELHPRTDGAQEVWNVTR